MCGIIWEDETKPDGRKFFQFSGDSSYLSSHGVLKDFCVSLVRSVPKTFSVSD